MIHIAVRYTTDWEDEARVRAQLPAGFAPLVDLWNATLSIPYHVFRVELKRIAGLSWSRVPGARVVRLGEVPDGAVVVPTDDDDWFSPELAQALEAGPAGWRWPSRFLEVPIHLRHRLGRIRRALFPNRPPKWICTTNNYACVKGVLPDECVMNHMIGSVWFGEHADRVRVLDRPLSLMNRTLASLTTLLFSGPMSRARLLRKYRSYARLYRRPLPADLSWAVPYVNAMADLMARLKPK